MNTYRLILSALITFSSSIATADITPEPKYTFESPTLNLTVTKAVQGQGEDEGYAIELKSDPTSKVLAREFGEGFVCSESYFGSGEDKSLKILTCEKTLNDRTFLYINVYPNKKDKSKVEAEVELFDAGLGTLLYEKFGSDFNRL